ncbi:MAG: M15 family metallopeptidase, partial [Clostridia bacterium]|nr:M15 family metallopeptidase [Clostridia bacterium]
VNLEHSLPRDYLPELIDLNSSVAPYILWDNHRLEPVTLDALNRLVADFYQATGCRRVLINSTYRSYEDQQDTYATYGPARAIVPGCSEHHTGMAVDMQIYDPSYSIGSTKKNAWYFYEYEDAAWLMEHFEDYGFILRYPDDKMLFTKIPISEPWHYRYVGQPHAKIISLRGDCLEEYVSYLKTLSFDGNRLFFDGTSVTEGNWQTVPKTGYVIYSVPVPSGSESVTVPILEGCVSYEISGTNDGFLVVTLKMG